MSKKFRIVIREVGATSNRTFTLMTLDDSTTTDFIFNQLKGYALAETEHDIAEDQPPTWVVLNSEGKDGKRTKRGLHRPR